MSNGFLRASHQVLIWQFDEKENSSMELRSQHRRDANDESIEPNLTMSPADE